jgi:hypothetical protein
VVDGDVVGEPRPLQLGTDLGAPVAERGAEERPRVIDRIERPEAVDHPEAEATGQERSVAPGPVTVLDQVTPQPGDVVAAVVVDDEQASTGSEHALRLGQVGRDDAAECGPDAHDRVDRGILHGPRHRPRNRRGPGTQGGVPGKLVRATVDDQDVAVPERTEAIESRVDLAFPIEGGPQDRRAVVRKRQRQIGHGREV